MFQSGPRPLGKRTKNVTLVSAQQIPVIRMNFAYARAMSTLGLKLLTLSIIVLTSIFANATEDLEDLERGRLARVEQPRDEVLAG